MSGFKAVAWDIDGTLIDSEPVHLAALIEVSARHGLDLSDEPEDRFLGLDLSQVWTQLAPLYPEGLDKRRWIVEITEAYCRRSCDLVVFADMIDAIRALGRQGVPQACVSNSERVIVDANIATLGIESLIAFSISRQDVSAGKPDPEPYRSACRRFGVSAHEVLAVEDSDAGARAAERAGLAVIRTDPARRHDTLRQIGALF